MLKWFECEEENRQNIISSKIRLARNWSEYVFPAKLSKEESREMVKRLCEGLADLGEQDKNQYETTYLEDLSELDRRALKERRVLNASVLSRKAPMALMVSEKEDISLVFNGTDHIRIQALSTGLHLQELLKTANEVDDFINARFSYAFDEKYGYLTSFPTNVGTGMRASVMVHLPSLSLGKKFSSVLTNMGRFGVSIRGAYGEGRENYGSIFEVTNQKTMGQTEKELADLVGKVAQQLNDQENQVRALTLKNHKLEREDEVYKSYGVLKYARRLTMKEAMTYLSQLMAGITDGLIKPDNSCSIYRLMLGIQTANLQKLSDRPLGKEELDVARAAYLRRELLELG
jgi:protein arginine kinase